MKAWLKARLCERSTKFAAMLVIALAGIAGLDLTVEQQAHIQQLLVLVVGLVMSFTPDKPEPK